MGRREGEREKGVGEESGRNGRERWRKRGDKNVKSKTGTVSIHEEAELSSYPSQ